MKSNITTKKIIFLGPEGSYCEKAMNYFCEKINCENFEHKYYSSIKKVIEHVAQDTESIGVIPIENSIEGIVRETMDNLLKLKDESLKITAETVVEINHCLISKSNDIKKIKNIISHPQALAQCQNNLHNLLGQYEQIEASSTSKAVRSLVDYDETYAAIGSECSAKFNTNRLFNILLKNLNDEPDNKTRFVLITREKTESTGSDRTSTVFATKNEAGALVKVLKVFDDLGINLCYIDSRPSKKNLGEYVFFVDFDGHIDDEISQKAMSKIRSYTNFVKILGSYPKF